MAQTYAAPGISADAAQQICDMLQDRLNSLADLSLTLKHIHWNVVGPQFIAVHEMLDDQVAAVRQFVDEVAERIAILGGVPQGTPGAIVAGRDWDDYGLGRADTQEHLAALDRVYQGVITDHRQVIEKLESLDLATQDLLIAQVEKLEMYHWFVWAHLEGSGVGRRSS